MDFPAEHDDRLKLPPCTNGRYGLTTGPPPLHGATEEPCL